MGFIGLQGFRVNTDQITYTERFSVSNTYKKAKKNSNNRYQIR